MTRLEIVAVVVSFAGIWLTAKRRMLCWPVNLVACALYFAVFLHARFYADMVLQALFGIAILYGWVSWTRGADDTGTIIVIELRPLEALAGLTAGAVGGVGIGWLTSRYTDAALPWMDATLTSFSLVAQFWTARGYAASWLLWIAVDILYVGMFVVKGLMPTAGLYATMIALAVMGYRRWLRAPSAVGK